MHRHLKATLTTKIYLKNFCCRCQTYFNIQPSYFMPTVHFHDLPMYDSWLQWPLANIMPWNILSRASETGSPTNRPGSNKTRGQGSFGTSTGGPDLKERNAHLIRPILLRQGEPGTSQYILHDEGGVKFQCTAFDGGEQKRSVQLLRRANFECMTNFGFAPPPPLNNDCL